MIRTILLLLLLGSPAAIAQTILAVPQAAIPFTVDRFVGFDAFGFAYGIRDNNLIKEKNGATAGYRNLSLGKISRVDLQNALGILLFYEAFNTVVLLDNQLNEIRRVNFSELPDPIVVSAAGMAAQNRFWVYDSLTQRIGFYDFVNSKFIPLTQSLKGNIKHYDSDFNYFYWIDESRHWYAADLFGKITSQGILPEYDMLQLAGPQVYVYMKAGQIIINDMHSGREYPVENVGKSFNGFTYKDQILSIFTTNAITNYKITLP